MNNSEFTKEFSNFFLENFDFCKVLYILTSFVPGGAWQQATFTLGSIVISWGAFLGSAINFIIIAIAVFVIAKAHLREEKVSKK
ncbi:MAG: MscL family protein [Nanoarchaeota archaeon]